MVVLCKSDIGLTKLKSRCGRAVLLTGGSGGEPASRLIEIVGGYHFHVVAGLRFLFLFWLLTLVIFSFKRSPAFLGSWILPSVSKASNGCLSPSYASDFLIPFPAPRSSLSLFLHISLTHSSTFLLCFSEPLWLHQAHSDNPGQSPYFKVSWLVTLISSAKSFQRNA